MEPPAFKVRRVDWFDQRDQLVQYAESFSLPNRTCLRSSSGMAPNEHATHVLAIALDGEAVGTARIKCDGRIGRMAVCKAWRDVVSKAACGRRCSRSR